jgi:hypothetical protein
VRHWSDGKALQKQRQLEDQATALSLMTVLGLNPEFVPIAVASALLSADRGHTARRIQRAREDANGAGVRIDAGFRCVNLPVVRDPCWPAFWIKPRS